ncbi:MAG TPA: hypothetical protein PK668_17240 [Myxococcota bacterium]|nr:hypothetical protein [Myxococcota bacterium]HRY94905.1 hypothetical protein [Myxococcota bacterium]HSA21817.1 hypothetical protein [Myxococcota bacterium]
MDGPGGRGKFPAGTLTCPTVSRILGGMGPRRRLLASLSVCLLCAAAPAAARPPPEPDPEEYADSGFGLALTLHAVLNFSYHEPGGGVGFQVAYPVVPNGFIPDEYFRDALLLEGGLDYVYSPADLGGHEGGFHCLSSLVGARYSVYVHDVLAPFAAVQIGYGGGLWDGEGVADVHRFGWATTLGLMWDFVDWASLRLDLGYGHLHEVVRLGVIFRL